MNALTCFLAFLLNASATTSPIATNLPRDLYVVSQGAQLFSMKLVTNVANGQPGNLICSPLSIHIALSMTAGGAGGSTDAQLKDVLKISSDKTQTLNGYQNIIESLNNVENVILNLVNKLFIRDTFSVKPEYKQELQTYYLSDIESIDFRQAAKAANTINTWCKEKTNNRIDSIVEESDITPDTELVLTNAVYFKSNWRNKFNPNYTTDRPFHINAITVKNVPTMYRSGDYKLVWLPKYEAHCVELPYANEEISMMIILPDKIDGLAALIYDLAGVTADCYTRLAHTEVNDVELYLPKFKTESKFDLTNTLIETMGLSEPFSGTANFSGISDVHLHIDKVLQKAFIEVNEEGSEAVAVSEIRLQPRVSSWVFEVDHPFLYTIVKSQPQNNIIINLFVGQVNDPTV